RGRDALGRDLLPVAFELFGDQLSKTGQRALAHFGARDADDAAVVRLDRDPDVHFRGTALRGRLVDDGCLEAEREAAAGECGCADHELAARETLAASKDHFF